MKVVDEQLLTELFGHYTESEKIQLENQVNIITNYILENVELYSKSKDFSKGVDDILKLILAGKLIQKENADETL